nr:WYL domain-containing protein [Mesorhizobium camelthorni]
MFRGAIRAERKLRIAYQDADAEKTERTIWPFQIGFFESVRLLSAWCESRNGIRHFRTDRILNVEELGERYPKRRHELVKIWRELEGVTDKRS